MWLNREIEHLLIVVNVQVMRMLEQMISLNHLVILIMSMSVRLISGLINTVSMSSVIGRI